MQWLMDVEAKCMVKQRNTEAYRLLERKLRWWKAGTGKKGVRSGHVRLSHLIIAMRMLTLIGHYISPRARERHGENVEYLPSVVTIRTRFHTHAVSD